MDEEHAEKFKAEVRFGLIERLVLMQALTTPRAAPGSSVRANQADLKRWLSQAAGETATIAGEVWKDPAMTAFYAGLAEDAADAIADRLDRLADELSA